MLLVDVWRHARLHVEHLAARHRLLGDDEEHAELHGRLAASTASAASTAFSSAAVAISSATIAIAHTAAANVPARLSCQSAAGAAATALASCALAAAALATATLAAAALAVFAASTSTRAAGHRLQVGRRSQPHHCGRCLHI